MYAPVWFAREYKKKEKKTLDLCIGGSNWGGVTPLCGHIPDHNKQGEKWWRSIFYNRIHIIQESQSR